MLRFNSGKFKPVSHGFNIWDHTLPEIYGIILAMFIKLDLVKCLNISEGELLDFIIDVDRGYLATYYHSFFHAADVTAVLYHILLDMNASQYLSKPDMAALLLAGLCHDIGHPGLNNLFQVNAKTELVKQHGDTSVLEKHSCSLAMDLVDKHKLFRNISSSPAGILPEGNYATEQSMKEAMVKAIMATDMSFHYDMLNNLNNLIEFTLTPSSSPSGSDIEAESDSDTDSAPTSPTDATASSASVSTTTTANEAAVAATHQSFQARLDGAVCHHNHSHCHSTSNHRRQSSSSSTSSTCSDVSVASDASSRTSRSITGASYRSASDLTPELRQNLCNCLLHAADISNAVKPWTLCKRWSDLVVQEFFRQGDIEKAQQLPVSPNMDRDQHNQPQISLGFGDFVVQPYFESFVEFLPEAAPFLAALANNREQWVMQKAMAEAEKEHGCAVAAESGSASNTNGETDTYVNVDTLADPTAEANKDSQGNSPLPSHLASGRRVSALAGKETSVNLTSVSTATPGGSPTNHDAVPISSSSLDSGVATKLSNLIGTSLPMHSENTTPRPPSPQPAQYRRRRHGSLQIGTQFPSIRQVYGDGYIVFDNEDHSLERMWDRRDHNDHYEQRDQHSDHVLEGGNSGHIPSAIHSAFPNSRHALLPPYSHPHPHQPFTASTTPQPTGSAKFAPTFAAAAPKAAELMMTPEQAMRFQTGESLPSMPALAAAASLTSSLAHNSNVRSSTPAIMSGQIQYDWSRPPPPSLPAFAQDKNGGRFGPLDHVIENHEGLAPTAAAALVPVLTAMALSPLLSFQTAVMSAAAVPSAAAASSATTPNALGFKSDAVVVKEIDKAKALPVKGFEVTMTESEDGQMGCVVGQTVDLPTTATSATKLSAQPAADTSGSVVSLSTASMSLSGFPSPGPSLAGQSPQCYGHDDDDIDIDIGRNTSNNNDGYALLSLFPNALAP
ncbi:hypothetical protein BGW39_007109 [Mortierella sp. 14UC]|nr:hypothetical protein BGW39_007109 [Mortierella sp. 14UC]